MLSNDASVPVRLQVLVSPASGSLAAAVYTTVLAARFSSTLAVAAEVTVGASLTLLMLRITALLPVRPPLSVSTTLKRSQDHTSEPHAPCNLACPLPPIH